jgi:aspartate/methionine/tyrosine aminotransferase
VAAIPVSAFYEGDAPRHYARFAFCKKFEVLDEALARLGHFVRSRQLTQTVRSA